MFLKKEEKVAKWWMESNTCCHQHVMLLLRAKRSENIADMLIDVD